MSATDLKRRNAPMSEMTSGREKGTVELREVTKRYDKEIVVDAVNVTIRAGEFFSLIGPSGSGKTTTLMMIAGFAEVDGGQIRVDGVDIVDVPPQRRGFGMVFQNYAIFPHLNVFDNVAFPLRARKIPAHRIREMVGQALELVRLERFADRFSRQLSGGQQQRIAIARAIVFEPSVVLMDEPLGALDKNLRYQMQLEIKEIQRRLGMTVIYVTHDQEEAMNMSDRIAIMHNGRIEQVGPAAHIYDNPTSRFIARFLGEANLIAGSVEDICDGTAVLRTADGLQFRARTTAGAKQGAAASLFVRPERVTIVREEPVIDDPMVNRATGRRKHTSFLGNILRHTVDIGGDNHVMVDVQNATVSHALCAGDIVRLSWRVSDSIMLAHQP